MFVQAQVKETNEQLIERYQMEMDEERKKAIKEKFFDKNKALPHYVARKFHHPRIDYEDMIGIATFGMLKAFETFDCSKGLKFTTYAARVMQNEVLIHFRKSEYKKDLTSFDSPISNDGEKDITLQDILEDPSSSFQSDVEQRELLNRVMDVAKEMLREKEYVVFLNMLSPKPKEQRVIGEQLGITQSYVSRLEKRVIEKLVDAFKEHREEWVGVEGMTEQTEPTIQVEGKTMREKIEYVLDHYPEKTTAEVAELVDTTKRSASTYISIIKKERRQEIVEEPPNIQSDDLDVTELDDEKSKRYEEIAKNALDKMVEINRQCDELRKQLEEVETMNRTFKKENIELRKSLENVTSERDELHRRLLKFTTSDNKQECTTHIERLQLLNRLLMEELIESNN